ncbi:hypothetical protein [Legionella septentrionalis]|uniref:hypothetical protein n=1 Tax=Legionella septentrionalis TaxID=2498109 RepID=UPI000F8D0BA3|nr:hypothetical protein [Legionella septentrionalis]RUR02877.1 hypothetical protein ELY11_00535 [Legionella septentrionalis]RUR11475.1 hypothetical protein ELY14_01645 [Legionella septentrionalis]RUR16740.1 hypothetical protein ELY10_02360 [Legionella septentrionalis]
MKICLIGNSHIACIKKAWDSLASQYPFTITFFGSHADTLLNTQAQDKKFTPTNAQVKRSFSITSGGQEEVDFTQFDICIVHGILTPLRNWFPLWRDLRKNIFYSRAFIDACIETFNPIVQHLIKEITACTKLPLIFTPKPNPAILERKQLISPAEYSELCSFMSIRFNALGLHYIPQPDETLADFFYTKAEFNKNGLGLGSVPKKEESFAPADNVRHMNAAYGEIYLKHVFNYINTTVMDLSTQNRKKINATNELQIA